MKKTFTEKELLIIQLCLLATEPSYVQRRFNMSEKDIKEMILSVFNKVSELLINPDDPKLHPLAITREVFDKYHDKIKGALEIIEPEEGDVMSGTAENHAILDLLGIIGIMTGKQLIPNQAQWVGPVPKELMELGPSF